MFERFTAEARRTVVLAQDEAHRMGHGQIGTEHLLLALLQDAETQATQALRDAAIRPEEVRAEIERTVPGGTPQPPGHLPFTPRSKKVLELALRESIKARHRNIEPEHILLGLLREGEGLAAQVLVSLGADLEELRTDVVRRLGPPQKRRFFGGEAVQGWTMTRAGTAAFSRARSLAGDKPLGSQHILLGLFGTEESVARRALEELGVTADALQAKLAELDPADTADEDPERAGARRTRLEVAGNVVTMRVEDSDLAARLATSLQQAGGASAEPLALSGADPEVAEPFARLWRAVQASSDEILQRLRREPERDR